MWPALDLERQPGVVGAAPRAALREVVAVQRARDHARRAREAEVLLQPLGQPGAAGPDADQHASGLQQRAHAAEQLGVERFGVELSRVDRLGGVMAGSARYCSRMIAAARAASTIGARRRCARLGRRVALVDLVHRQAEAAVQLAREAPRAPRVVVRRAVGMERHADDQRSRAATRRSARRSRRSAPRPRRRPSSAASPCASASCRWRRRRGGCRNRKRERTSGSGARPAAHAAQRRRRLMRAPPPELSMRGVDAEQRQRLVVALARPACRR